jgi:hypothetical protein
VPRAAQHLLLGRRRLHRVDPGQRPAGGRVPDRVEPLNATPLTCAGVTTSLTRRRLDRSWLPSIRPWLPTPR